MKYTILLVLTVLLFLSSPVAQEGQSFHSDGNDLLPRCKAVLDMTNTWNSYHEAYSVGFCFGLVEGIGYGSSSVCPGKGVTLLQEVRVVVKYLEDNPQILNLGEDDLTNTALSKAFPCKKQ